VQNLNVSKQKIYQDPEQGGLGLFKLADVMVALQCSWFKRIMFLRHDNWQNTLFNVCESGLLFIQERDTANLGPLLQGISRNLISFRENFGLVGNNFWTVPILNNRHFVIREGNNVVSSFDWAFFETYAPNIDSNILNRLTWETITEGGVIKSFNQFNDLFNGDLNIQGYQMLTAGFMRAQRKFNDPQGKKVELESMFRSQSKKKGSKQFRILLNKGRYRFERNNCPIRNFSRIGGITLPDLTSVKCMNSLWSTHYFPSDFRTFLFKFHHNTLGLNIRVQHINAECDAACFFCNKSKNFPAERESVEHFFWFCPTTSKLIERFGFEYLNTAITKELYFTGTRDNNFELASLIVMSVIKFCLWQFKLRKKTPSWYSFISDFNFILNSLTAGSKKLKIDVSNSTLFRRYGD
jgi:hypothetical protein